MKVHAVKNKLDEMIQQRLMNDGYQPDARFDCVDMEMSDDDANNEKENSKYSNGYRGGSSSSYMRTNSGSSIGGGASGSVRTNLDPRQNRTPTSSSKKSSHYYDGGGHESHSSSASGGNGSKRRHSGQDNDLSSHKAKERDRSGTPVRDEMPPPVSSSSQTSAPLDFLTKFINKSSNGPPSSSGSSDQSSNTSKNLSFIFNQLQKIVNNPAPPSTAALSSSLMAMSATPGAENPMDAHYQHGHFSNMPYYDPNVGMSYAPAGTFIMNQQAQGAPPRSGTPTKDEMYSAASIQYAQVATPTMLPSPNAPGAYNPIMAPPINSIPPPPSPYHPLYSPQLMQPNLGLPPPQLMIDPNSPTGSSYQQGYIQFNQPPPQVSPHGYYPSQTAQAKVLVSPVSVGQSVNPFWTHQQQSQQQHQMDAALSEKQHDTQSVNSRKGSSSELLNESYSPPGSDHRHNRHSMSPTEKSRYSNKYPSTPSSSANAAAAYKRKYSNSDEYDHGEDSEQYRARGGAPQRDNTSRHYGNGRHY